MQAKEYDLADKNGLADFLEDADIQLVPRARGRVTPTPNPAITMISSSGSSGRAVSARSVALSRF